MDLVELIDPTPLDGEPTFEILDERSGKTLRLFSDFELTEPDAILVAKWVVNHHPAVLRRSGPPDILVTRDLLKSLRSLWA